MNEIIHEEEIKRLIFEIRGKRVILASDVAKLYQVETFRINEVVKRNINRFPSEFCFQLSKEEYNSIFPRSQIAILNRNGNKRGTNIKYLPYVFTEHGVIMLSGLLKSDIAAKVNVQVIKAFVEMKQLITNEIIEQKYINNLVFSHDNEIKLINKTLKQLENKELKNQVYYVGEIYDAYSKLIDIMKKAKEELIIIDNYADKSVLDMISSLENNVILITKAKGVLKKVDVEKYNKQYHNLKLIYNDSFHDRYIIIDKKIIYHCGTSLNFAGNKTFGINILTEKEVSEVLLNKIKKIIGSI